MAAHPHQPRLSYSNLEAVPAPRWNPQQYGGLEVVPEGHHHGYEYSDKQAVWPKTDSSHHPYRYSHKNDKIAVNPVPDRQAPEVVGYEHTAPPPAVLPTICGVRRKIFWVVVGVAVFLVAVGGGVGGYMASRPKPVSSEPVITENNSTSSTNPTSPTGPKGAPFQKLSIAALQWLDGKKIGHYRVYTQSQSSSNRTQLLESAWDSDTQTWTVSPITDEKVDTIKPGTPISVSAGHPHTNTSLELVKSVFFLQPSGTLVERQSPYKGTPNAWGNDNFSGLYTASSLSSLFSHWYQDLTSRTQILATFFQELGANSLTVGRYVETGNDNGLPWETTKHSVSIADGSPIVAVPAGANRRDLRLYVGGTDGTMKQYPYNLEKNVLGSPVSTAIELAPHTPFCVTIEDNRNFFTNVTLPECTRTSTGTFITHLLLFASPDRRSLSMVSWNCSSGFVAQDSRIEGLLRPGRTYLGLATTSASNLTFFDQRVYVMFDEGQGPQVEEWEVPASGGVNVKEQNGPWRLRGGVPIRL